MLTITADKTCLRKHSRSYVLHGDVALLQRDEDHDDDGMAQVSVDSEEEEDEGISRMKQFYSGNPTNKPVIAGEVMPALTMLPRPLLSSYLSEVCIRVADTSLLEVLLEFWSPQDHGCWTLMLSAGPVPGSEGHFCVLLHDLVCSAMSASSQLPMYKVLAVIKAITSMRPSSVLDRDQEGQSPLHVALSRAAVKKIVEAVAPLSHCHTQEACELQELSVQRALDDSHTWGLTPTYIQAVVTGIIMKQIDEYHESVRQSKDLLHLEESFPGAMPPPLSSSVNETCSGSSSSQLLVEELSPPTTFHSAAVPRPGRPPMPAPYPSPNPVQPQAAVKSDAMLAHHVPPLPAATPVLQPPPLPPSTQGPPMVMRPSVIRPTIMHATSLQGPVASMSSATPVPLRTPTPPLFNQQQHQVQISQPVITPHPSELNFIMQRNPSGHMSQNLPSTAPKPALHQLLLPMFNQQDKQAHTSTSHHQLQAHTYTSHHQLQHFPAAPTTGAFFAPPVQQPIHNLIQKHHHTPASLYSHHTHQPGGYSHPELSTHQQHCFEDPAQI
ncbi:hypothetical protein CEUSTIGMA_g10163.t1 [Chlamydomonas eustigma]|uniref:Uncharacterized protein n=1 Tax=Chlamydomonas eustigma TaxID=1157962 RepID=A0A250XI22_9CHLO|nr:hypothetical protein CEUSTIGMA_g10163.t1 [Chlamydomonas eustigma]|eukprot:GAX82737.1 hypothetical protein CEUSTIGMA_g10163.t1 [Chlamydomonas eustigma]